MNVQENTTANEVQTENIVKRILTSEAKYIIGIIIFLVGVVGPYYSIKSDIALIKQNHSAHIETMQRNIESMQAEITDMKKTEVELMKEIAKQGALMDLKTK